MQDDCLDVGRFPVQRTAPRSAHEGRPAAHSGPDRSAEIPGSDGPDASDRPGRANRSDAPTAQRGPAGSDGTAGTPEPAGTAGLLADSGYLLARLGAEARRRWARMLSEHGLTPHHYGVLMTLDDLRVTYQQRLSRAIGVDPRNAVPVLDHLQRRGLIERRRDPADRRRHAIALTEEGRTAVTELRRAAEVVEGEIFEGLTAAERAALHRLLRKLFEATF